MRCVLRVESPAPTLQHAAPLLKSLLRTLEQNRFDNARFPDAPSLPDRLSDDQKKKIIQTLGWQPDVPGSVSIVPLSIATKIFNSYRQWARSAAVSKPVASASNKKKRRLLEKLRRCAICIAPGVCASRV